MPADITFAWPQILDCVNDLATWSQFSDSDVEILLTCRIMPYFMRMFKGFQRTIKVLQALLDILLGVLCLAPMFES